MASTRHHPDVIVVGGGVVGVASALALAAAGARVEVIADSAEPSATDASGAMLGELAETPYSTTPSEAEQVEGELRAAAAAKWATWAGTVGLPESLLQNGTFVYANPHRPDDERGLLAIESRATQTGRPVQRVDPEDIPGLQPSPGHRPTRAIFLPEEQFVDAPALLRTLWQRARESRRVELRAGRVTGLQKGKSGNVCVAVANGPCFEAAQVFLCAGTGTTPIVSASPDLGVVPDVLSAKGVALQVRFPPRLGSARPIPHAIRSPNRDFACGMHVVPRGDALYLGATNRATRWPGITGRISVGEVIRLLATAERELLSGLSRWEVEATYYGERPLSADGLPIVSKTELDGVFIATATYRNGVLLAPLVARIAVELAHGRAGWPAIALGPTRCPPGMTADSALRAGLRDYASLLRDPEGPPLLPTAEDLLATVGAMLAADPAGDHPGYRHAKEVLGRYPLAEMVPEAIIEACHPELLP